MPTIFLDTETTGLNFNTCRITELAFIDDDHNVTYDEFVKIPKDLDYPKKVQEITHITMDILQNEGKPEEEVAKALYEVLAQDDVIVVTHNVHFDANFMIGLLNRNNLEMPKNVRYLDTLTVARDWIPSYNHKLETLIEFFELEDKVVNSHRAIDDTLALRAVFIEMLKYLKGACDIDKYINKLGYLPRFGKPSDRLEGVDYYPQDPKYGLTVYDKL